jgi:hypothetical protein
MITNMSRKSIVSLPTNVESILASAPEQLNRGWPVPWYTDTPMAKHRERFLTDDDPRLFLALPGDVQRRLLAFCMSLTHSRQLDRCHTSYNLKHVYERFMDNPACAPELDRIPGYTNHVMNGAFKGAMIVAGFRVADESEVKWCFNVSKKCVADLKFLSCHVQTYEPGLGWYWKAV